MKIDAKKDPAAASSSSENKTVDSAGASHEASTKEVKKNEISSKPDSAVGKKRKDIKEKTSKQEGEPAEKKVKENDNVM